MHGSLIHSASLCMIIFYETVLLVACKTLLTERVTNVC